MCYIYSDLELWGQTNTSPKQTDSISSLIKADGLKGKAALAVALLAPCSSAWRCQQGANPQTPTRASLTQPRTRTAVQKVEIFVFVFMKQLFYHLLWTSAGFGFWVSPPNPMVVLSPLLLLNLFLEPAVFSQEVPTHLCGDREIIPGFICSG